MAVQLPRFSRDTAIQFFSQVYFPEASTCWLWMGSSSRKGYGLFAGTSAHRTPYTWFVGSIPDGYVVDHLCRVPACVNPAHLEAVTICENNWRGKMARTTCKSGRHPAYDRLYHGHNWNTCRVCRLESRQRWLNKMREFRARRRAA